MDDQNEVDKYFENQMPSPETLPLFELARAKGIGFYLGYAERTRGGRQAAPLQHLDPGRARTAG